MSYSYRGVAKTLELLQNSESLERTRFMYKKIGFALLYV
jgi:hypothetical protein